MKKLLDQLIKRKENSNTAAASASSSGSTAGEALLLGPLGKSSRHVKVYLCFSCLLFTYALCGVLSFNHRSISAKSGHIFATINMIKWLLLTSKFSLLDEFFAQKCIKIQALHYIFEFFWFIQINFALKCVEKIKSSHHIFSEFLKIWLIIIHRPSF